MAKFGQSSLRENTKYLFLAFVWGMQVAVVEFGRNVL